MKLEELLTKRKYRKLSVKKLEAIIGGRDGGLSFSDYEKLPGVLPWDKAKLLYEKWHGKKKK